MQDQQAKIRASTAESVRDLLRRGKDLSQNDCKQIIQALHATWSEIRKDTAKSIVQLGLYDEKLLSLILDEVDNESVLLIELPWQMVHGCMLGINAILLVLGLRKIDTVNSERAKTLCLRLQGYTQLLVREEVYKCLNFLFTNGDKEGQLALLDSMLRGVAIILTDRERAAESLKASATSPRHLTSSPERSPRAATDVERSAYALDGTLCLLQSMLKDSSRLSDVMGTPSPPIPLPPSAFNAADVGATVFSGADPALPQGPQTEPDSPSLLMTIMNCMGDFSATVRQSAAAALLAVLDKCDGGDKGKGVIAQNTQRSIMVYLTDQVDEAAAAAQHHSWFLLESCLLVAEGILKRGIDSSCKLIRIRHSDDISLTDVEVAYYSSLQRALPSCILSTSFEVRRVGSQIVPLLARLLCLMMPEAVFLQRQPGEGEGAAAGTCAGSALYSFYWLSETAKAAQHLQEVFFHEAEAEGFSTQGSITDSTGPPSPSSPEAHSLWAMEVTGRFGEEEAKAHFRQLMRSLLHAGEPLHKKEREVGQGPRGVVRMMQDKSRVIANGIKEQLPKLLRVWKDVLDGREGEALPTFSLDVAEATALALCVSSAPCSSDYDGGRDSLYEWIQTWGVVPFLLTHSSSRYKGQLSPQGGIKGTLHFFPPPISAGDSPGAAALGELSIIPPLSDPTTPPPLSAGSEAVTAATIRSIHSTNRSLCEAVGPVLPTLSILQRSLGAWGADSGSDAVRHVLALCCLCAHWICCCLCDAQLLERRQHVRSGLSSSLASLLTLLPGQELGQTDVADLQELVYRAVALSAGQIDKRHGSSTSARGVTAPEALELGLLARCVKLLDGLCSAPSSFRLSVVDTLRTASKLLGTAEARSSPVKIVGTLGAPPPAESPGKDKEEQLEATGDYSDWDEESDDELNASHSSVGPMLAETEVSNCLQEIEQCLQALTV